MRGAYDVTDEQRLRIEIKRTTLVAALALILQTAYVLDPQVRANAVLFLSALALIAFSLCYVAYTIITQNDRAVSLRMRRGACYAYWTVLALAIGIMVFFDLEHEPVQYRGVLLLYALMVYLPFHTVGQEKKIYAVLILLLVALVTIKGVGVVACLEIVGGGIAMALLSFSLHNGYFQMLRALRIEGDMDGMTKLYTKTAGISRMNGLYATCKRLNRRVAAYYIDIDHFKSYNDTYGHAEGDVVLVDVAGRIKSCFSRESDVVCRMGGEEFAALIPVADEEIARKMGKRLIRMVADMCIKSGAQARLPVVTISVGLIVTRPAKNRVDDIAEILDLADQQLYIAKSNGRNCIAMDGGIIYRGTLR
ncbi:MAG: GGDEF domain-containing protein [Clostridiales bacterium]|jgi:diguanylate cyclase (GGDEF)-like protein|nr:GGDEF domain-containing protein [Clostridiales bacterium]